MINDVVLEGIIVRAWQFAETWSSALPAARPRSDYEVIQRNPERHRFYDHPGEQRYPKFKH